MAAQFEPADQLLLPAALVTGEAVEVDLRPASFATRMLAWLLDLVVVAGASWALTLALSGIFALNSGPVDDAAGSAVALPMVTTVSSFSAEAPEAASARLRAKSRRFTRVPVVIQRCPPGQPATLGGS